MKKLFKNIFYFFSILFLLGACQSVKDGLTGKKKNNSDEFLVEKKNPLVLPPDFETLPKPKVLIKDDKKNNEIDLKSIITKSNTKIEKKSIDKTLNGSLEKSILEKIKSN
ncbi:DUF3035 domain-containing protein [Candidatus Pelagibacter sp.]|nr:DUF3035 domain-containing protein [Candidatus Pelagibacter sp.]